MDKLATTHTQRTKGGAAGHWWRRLVHVLIAVLPILYYQYGGIVSAWFGATPMMLLLFVFALNILLEAIRLYFGITIWGHRDFESKQISSFAWGMFAICLVLLFFPPMFSIPIIWGCAFVDPLLGELRRTKLSFWLIEFIGLIALLLVWWIATWWLRTPWWFALFMAPVALLSEWPTLKCVDDNATMQLVPAFVIFLVLLFT